MHRTIKPVFLPLGDVVYEPNARREPVYFPTTSIISLSYVLADGGSAEFAVVGNDGFIGVPVFTGGATMPSWAIVQREGWAYRFTSRLPQAELMQGAVMRHLMLQSAQALITQIAQTIICNRHHSIEQRICRRLLLGLDRANADELTLTHDRLADLPDQRRRPADAEMETAIPISLLALALSCQRQLDGTACLSVESTYEPGRGPHRKSRDKSLGYAYRTAI